LYCLGWVQPKIIEVTKSLGQLFSDSVSSNFKVKLNIQYGQWWQTLSCIIIATVLLVRFCKNRPWSSVWVGGLSRKPPGTSLVSVFTVYHNSLLTGSIYSVFSLSIIVLDSIFSISCYFAISTLVIVKVALYSVTKFLHFRL